MAQALALQRAGNFKDALAIYEQCISQETGNADAWHMGGVALLQLGRASEAARFITRAGELVGDPAPRELCTNLGLCVAAQAEQAQATCPVGGAMQDRFLRQDLLPETSACPSVSVVLFLRSGDLAGPLAGGIDFREVPRAELIVVGKHAAEAAPPSPSTSAGPEVLKRHPTGDATVAEALNAGVEKAMGDVVFLMDSCDVATSTWVPVMARALSASGLPWGFCGVDFLDNLGEVARPGAAAHSDAALESLERRYLLGSWFEGYASFNFSVTVSNVVATRELWLGLGGLNPVAEDPSWDFAKRALLVSDPAYVDEPLLRTPRTPPPHGKYLFDRTAEVVAWLQSCADQISPSDRRFPSPQLALRELAQRCQDAAVLELLRQGQGHRFSLTKILSLLPPR